MCVRVFSNADSLLSLLSYNNTVHLVIVKEAVSEFKVCFKALFKTHISSCFACHHE